MTKTTRRFVLLGALFFGSVFALAAATEPDGGMGVKAPASTGAYDHETLQADARMTQGMSRPDADTGAQYHRRDEQLAHSSSSSFLRAFEAHHADIDRMLGLPRGGVTSDLWCRMVLQREDVHHAQAVSQGVP